MAPDSFVPPGIVDRERAERREMHDGTILEDRIIPIPTSEHEVRRSGSYSGEGPCTVCGRDVLRPAAYVHEVEGGGFMIPRGEPYTDEGADLGLQPVGSECVKLIPKEYRHRPGRD